ncbi:MAG: MMPL family transporter [Verrucomicrobia bacterium]|nr:MMPL family transporter [Verrucomicrobiota bacterium]
MIRSRLFKIVLAIFVAALVTLGLSRISFNVDILKLLPQQLNEVQGLSLYLKHFARHTELMITLEAEDSGDAEVFSDSLAEFLRERPDLIKSVVHRAPWEDQASETSEIIAWLWLSQPPGQVEALLARLGSDEVAKTLDKTVQELSTSMAVQEVATLSYDPLRLTDVIAEGMQDNAGQSEFSSADGTFRVLYVEAPARLANYREIIGWVHDVKALLAEWKSAEEGGDNVSIGVTGEPAFVAEISGGMERDMHVSAGSTIMIIGIIFWLFYRRVKPLNYLLLLLVAVFVGSLAVSGFVLNELTVISVGFASILIGLSVDYGVVLYQELLGNDVQAAKRRARSGIIWAALTTAAAFACLNASGLPGLAQLGTMVAIGVLLGAFVMLTFLPNLVFKSATQSPQNTPSGPIDAFLNSAKALKGVAFTIVITLLVLGAALWMKGLPELESNSRPLRLRHSLAYETMDRIYMKLADSREMLTLLVSGKNPEQVQTRLSAVDAKLAVMETNGLINQSMLPVAFWPVAKNQKTNLERLKSLTARKESLKEQVLAADFTDESFLLVESVMQHWDDWSSREPMIWPENDVSRWMLRQNVFHDSENFLAVGLVRPVDARSEAFQNALDGLKSEGIYIAGWEQLGRSVTDSVSEEMLKVLLLLMGVLLLMLSLAFRNVLEVALIFGLLALSFVSLLGAMALLGLTWNLFNLTALLLLLGTGVDYSIHILLALRKSGGNVIEVQKTTGKAILVCGLSTCAGFGSLSWASNIGLASLGQVCALGILLNLLISVFLLPHLWICFAGKGRMQTSNLPISSDCAVEKK